MLKIAVLAPMPSASVINAISVNPGDLRSMRRPKRMSWNSVTTLHPANERPILKSE
jgi:hypothetical protein